MKKILCLFLMTSILGTGCAAKQQEQLNKETQVVQQELIIDELKESEIANEEEAEFKEALILMTQLTLASVDNLQNLGLKASYTNDEAEFKAGIENIASTYNVGFEAFRDDITVPDTMVAQSKYKKAIIVFEFFYNHYNFMALALGEEDLDSFSIVLDSYYENAENMLRTLYDNTMPYLNEQ